MIGYLKGKVLEVGAETALILVGGVGYEVYCTGTAFSKMAVGQECEIYTYMQISEQNGVQLFGFESRKEKSMFLRLVSVSGVGPKIGLSLLTAMNVEDVAIAIATGDTKLLCRAKGLGKKMAERIILELKESVGALSVPAGSAAASGVAVKESGDEDAVVALMSLGFTRAESETAVIKAKQKGAKTVEEIIMIALKGM